MTTPRGTLDLVAAAAADNAEWCEVVCRLHGVPGEFSTDAWTSPRRTPPLYPDAVTLGRDVSPQELLARVDASPGCSVKDSYGSLDLRPAGFEPLFAAEWIHRAEDLAPPVPSAGTAWSRVSTAEDLAAWEAAWGGSDGSTIFLPGLLDEPAVTVLAGRSQDGVVAGAIAHLSEAVVGVSNVFSADGDPSGAWAGVVAAVHELFPGLPVVGYEHGDDLHVALGLGFTRVGGLRVWWRPRCPG